MRQRVARFALRLFARWEARKTLWRRRLRREAWAAAGLHIADSAFLEDTVKIDLRPVGQPAGGRVSVERGAKLSDGVILVPWGGSVTVGENVFVGPYCVLSGQGGLTVGRDTLIAGHTFIVAGSHSYADRSRTVWSQTGTARGIVIGEDVWIGCGVRILDGVTIGRGCVVGAGAVVTKSLPDWAVAVGVPARVVGTRGTDGKNGSGTECA